MQAIIQALTPHDTTNLKVTLVALVVLGSSATVFTQVNYDAGRNLKEWTNTGDYLVDSHEWFGDTLILSSVFRYVFDTVQSTQGDTVISIVRYGSAQGIHIYPDENSPATINIVDTAFIPISKPVRYKHKMYWGGQKSFTPPDTSSWIVLYEFDLKTLAYKTLTLHDADAGFHYLHGIDLRGDLLSIITRAGIRGDREYYLNIVDPSRWELVSQAQIEWTTGDMDYRNERLLTSDVQVLDGDTTVIFSGLEDANNSPLVYVFKSFNLHGQELMTDYIGDVNSSRWSNERRNYDRPVLALRSDSMLFYLSNHIHFEYEADSTSPTDFKAHIIDPFTYNRIDSSDIGDPTFVGPMQNMIGYTTIGDTLIAVGKCGWTFAEDDIRPGEPGYQKTFGQLGVLAYDMNTLKLIWKKRIIAETEFGSLSDNYGVTNSPHNFVSATAMTWYRNVVDNSFDNEVRVIHLNKNGCPSADPAKTCDDLIWLDQYVSDSDELVNTDGVVQSLRVVPSLFATGMNNSIQFDAKGLNVESVSSYTVQLFDSNARVLGQANLLTFDTPYALPSSLKAGVYYAFLKSSTGKSIGVGKFVIQ